MTDLLVMAKGAAKSPTTILITGESGVGKDLVARYIHRESKGRPASFVGVNCAGLTEARFESELFGQLNGNVIGAAPRSAASSGSRIAVRCFSTKSET